jgi:hypothetical protein
MHERGVLLPDTESLKLAIFTAIVEQSNIVEQSQLVSDQYE